MIPQSPDIIASTARAWRGMVRILFKPFDIKKWFILGFTAWLAQLMESGGSSLNTSFNNGNSEFAGTSPEDQLRAKEMFLQWIQDHLALIITVASVLLMLVVAVFIALVWVRSRGKFMFLDNVVHNRCRVQAPWHQFKEEGDSLCKWTLLLTAVFAGMILLFAGLTGRYVFDLVQNSAWTTGSVISVIVAGLFFGLLALIWYYIQLLLVNFIVPIMYRDRITATAAWRKFLPLHRCAFWRFILFALWMLLLSLGCVVVVAVLGFATCCLGWIIMALPYLGTVLLLPVFVFFRLLGPDYLRQFGNDFDALSISVPELPRMSLESDDRTV